MTTEDKFPIIGDEGLSQRYIFSPGILRVLLNRTLGRWLSQLSVLVAMTLAGAYEGLAIPIDRFDAPLDVECVESAQCAGVARSESTVGRYTGVTLSRRGDGEVAATVSRKGAGHLTFEASGATSATMTLSWDADQHPEVLSGSGLNCIDLTREGAYAFVLSHVNIDSTCSNEQATSGCPSFGVETRVYDARDPTGQRFSGSVINRTLTEETDVVIPFSNFVREGPRGRADLSCAGAITMTFRFDGFESVEMEIGPLYTNGAEGLTPLPTATAMPSATPTFTPDSTAVATEISVNTAVPTAPASEPSAEASTAGGASPAVTDVTPTTPPIEEAVQIAETPRPQPVLPDIPKEQEEEIVYGEVVPG